MLARGVAVDVEGGAGGEGAASIKFAKCSISAVFMRTIMAVHVHATPSRFSPRTFKLCIYELFIGPKSPNVKSCLSCIINIQMYTVFLVSMELS